MINRNTTPAQRAEYKTATPATQAEMIRQALAKQTLDALRALLAEGEAHSAPAEQLDLIRTEIASRTESHVRRQIGTIQQDQSLSAIRKAQEIEIGYMRKSGRYRVIDSNDVDYNEIGHYVPFAALSEALAYAIFLQRDVLDIETARVYPPSKTWGERQTAYVLGLE